MRKAGQGAFLALTLVALAAASSVLADPAVHGIPTPPPLPASDIDGRVTHLGARIWFATYGRGPPVILLHGGMASSDVWGDLVPALTAAGRQVIVIDSRGQGRSTLGPRPLGYELMESDVIAVMDLLEIQKANLVGWSDGAIVALVMAMKHPARIGRVFAFGANMDVAGLNPLGLFSRDVRAIEPYLRAAFVRDTGSIAGYERMTAAVLRMQLTQPHYTAGDLAEIHGPQIVIADGDHDELISHHHTRWLAGAIPGAQLIWLPNANHFAPLEAADAFDRAVLAFLGVRGDAAAQ